MRRKKLEWSLVCLCLLACLSGTARAADQEYRQPDARELVALVRAAAELVRQKGEAAFAELNQAGGRWYQDDRYVFVDTCQGVEVVNPAFPEFVGKDILNLRDAHGKTMVRDALDLACGPRGGQGWVFYQWPRPGAVEPSWKSSYVVGVRAPSGQGYVVGSGAYGLGMEHQFLVQKVDQACELIRQKGEAAFPELRRTDGQFVFRDTYVFVDSAEGVELVNPAFPGLEGRNLLRLTNLEGKPLVREYIDLVKAKGSGWVSYYWPKPGERAPSLKHTFVKGVEHGGKLYIVGCGGYPE